MRAFLIGSALAVFSLAGSARADEQPAEGGTGEALEQTAEQGSPGADRTLDGRGSQPPAVDGQGGEALSRARQEEATVVRADLGRNTGEVPAPKGSAKSEEPSGAHKFFKSLLSGLGTFGAMAGLGTALAGLALLSWPIAVAGLAGLVVFGLIGALVDTYM